MQIPNKPANELERLRALKELEIMDSIPEDAFDEITNLVCRIFDVPICAISFLDHERQWFKSIHGLSMTQIARDISFCGHTISANKTFIVPDASQDMRFWDNPLVKEGPRVRFYIGEPIVDSEGHALGALCAIDVKPRELSEDQVKTLKLLAKTVFNQISLRKNVLDLQRENARIARLHQVAQSYLYKSQYEVAEVDISEDVIWYLIKDKVVTGQRPDTNKILKQKIDEVSQAGESVILFQEQMRFTLELIHRGKNGKDTFSLRAEYTA